LSVIAFTVSKLGCLLLPAQRLGSAASRRATWRLARSRLRCLTACKCACPARMPSSATRATCRDLRGPGLGKALALHTYDACLIMAGTNDLAEGERGLRPEDAVESLARLIRVSTCTCVARCTRSANIAATVAPALACSRWRARGRARDSREPLRGRVWATTAAASDKRAAGGARGIAPGGTSGPFY
jgi:hypothetical protein